MRLFSFPLIGRFLYPVLATTVAVVLAACGGPPPPTDFNDLYSGLSESLPKLDPAVLEGRRILIDPGHGGYFSGTVGRDSLAEASVNLGVSLYLWGLLNEAGADVYITRSADRDFLSEEDSSLASDLRSRVAMADSLEPDMLISIHHNAQPQRDPSRNRVETYYRAGDAASLDLAFSIHRHLMRNLGIDKGVVRQGNYLILRESKVPAVLGESSYLTSPAVESKLKLSEAQKLEAEAYFLGILEYFSHGIPRIQLLSPVDSIHTDSIPALVFAMEDDGGHGIDPDGIAMTLNGRTILPVLDGGVGTLFYQPPWDLPNGSYDVAVSVRNLGGNTSATHTDRFIVDFAPEFAAFDFTPDHLPPRGRAIRVRARFLDRRGVPVLDGKDCRVFTSLSTDTIAPPVENGAIDVILEVPEGTASLTIFARCGDKRFETVVKPDKNERLTTQTVYLKDAITGAPINNATVNFTGRAMRAVSESGTYIHAETTQPESPRDAPLVSFTIEAPGFQPVLPALSQTDTILMTPWFGGVLHGIRFLLDPEGGRTSVTGQGPLGLSGSHANLQVGRYLAGFLRLAGADVLLTRTNEEVRTPEDIARITNRYGANRYIEIRHRVQPDDSLFAVRTYHFPGSRNGRRMAESVLRAVERRLDIAARGPFDTVTYPLQQTACPAIIFDAPSIGVLDEELRLAESWYQREQAYAVFLGLLDHYAVPDSGAVIAAISGENKSGWRITLDATWTLVTGDTGKVVFDKVPPGTHRLSAYKSDQHLGGMVVLEPGRNAEIRLEPVR